MKHLVPISGKDSLATALVQTTRRPDLAYEFLFTDTGCELPETYAWLERVEQRTGWQIERVGESLEEKIVARNFFLPSPRARYCTKECKIQPMERLLKGHDAIVYYGLRADENRTGYVPVAGSRIKPCYPLQEMGIDLRGVYSILTAQDLLPPDFHWPRLYEAVKAHIPGDWDGELQPWERSVLFSGRTRANCYFCFYQRQYEFLWLRETHHEHYLRAAAMEKERYTFQPGFRLTNLEDADTRDKIFRRRVKDVCRQLANRLQRNLFEVEDGEIALTSCGLLCGK